MYIFLLSCLRTSTLDNQAAESNDIHSETRESSLRIYHASKRDLCCSIMCASCAPLSDVSRMIASADFSYFAVFEVLAAVVMNVWYIVSCISYVNQLFGGKYSTQLQG
jgi:hypothetical protein